MPSMNTVLVWILLGFYAANACEENHTRCVESHQWKYRTYREFHHINSAQICRATCSVYQGRVNYFTFDVSIHRCLCVANCLIDRGSHTKNDVVGTHSDADPSGLCQVLESPPIEQKSRNFLVVGENLDRVINSFDLVTNTTSACDIPALSGSNVQFAFIDNQLHVCSMALVRLEYWQHHITCQKFDENKKIWVFVDKIQFEQRLFRKFLLLPNGNIVIAVMSRYLNLYDGKQILIVSENYPYHEFNHYNYLQCLTAISNEEIVVGLVIAIHNEHDVIDNHLHIINLRTGNVTKSRPVNLPITGCNCGAFGPEDNRKVLIFDGELQVSEKWTDSKPFTSIIVFDPKSGEFNFTDYEWSDVRNHEALTVPYGDTFLLYYRLYEGQFRVFDYNRTQPQFVYAGVLPGKYKYLATVPSKSGFTCGRNASKTEV